MAQHCISPERSEHDDLISQQRRAFRVVSTSEPWRPRRHCLKILSLKPLLCGIFREFNLVPSVPLMLQGVTPALAVFVSKQGERPKLTTTVLQARLKRSDLIANSLSNYFKERAVIEADYSKKLSKLHAKGHIVPDSYGLGHDSGFDAVLKSLEQELERQIRLHDNFGSRLESTVAASLKDTAKSGEASYRNHESAALSIANRLEDVNSKLQKVRPQMQPPGGLIGFRFRRAPPFLIHPLMSLTLLRPRSLFLWQAQGGKTTFRKGGDTTKLQSDVDDMQDSWMQTAPSYLNAAQRAEVGRLEEIQQNLAKYETLCSDLAREKMELSESSLMKVRQSHTSAKLFRRGLDFSFILFFPLCLLRFWAGTSPRICRPFCSKRGRPTQPP